MMDVHTQNLWIDMAETFIYNNDDWETTNPDKRISLKDLYEILYENIKYPYDYLVKEIKLQLINSVSFVNIEKAKSVVLERIKFRFSFKDTNFKIMERIYENVCMDLDAHEND